MSCDTPGELPRLQAYWKHYTDRASSYSSAINEVCPDAIQIADRFHLLMNLSHALDQYFKSVWPEIRLRIKNKTEEIIKTSASGKLPDEI